MDVSLSGKRVLVTGAGRGIGRALAIRAAACGAHVIAVSRTQQHLDTLKAECPSVETVTCDLGDWEATRKALEPLEPVDCLVNNAGIVKHAPFMEITESQIDQTFGVNLKAVINVSQVVGRGMAERGKGGVIVNVSSILSTMVKGTAVYCASKAALDHLSRVMALELGPKGIRVNTVNPGVVRTDMTERMWQDPERAAALQKAVPLGRFAETEDVVGPILFLLSDSSSLVSGASLLIHGGSASA
ncbi:L-xylulose reductase-like [Amphibalanus amphitrite]|uniref:L-xylulose reductase-like n=1 Tax=Amphibalanus amphitrite TaxID=1232801 RepID=UPI001C915BEC|nr:L-xylulose reductase-like [Amphibalanus amphitrite]